MFANETIVEQPAQLLTLSERYTQAAEGFMAAAGRPFLLLYASHHVHSPQFAGAACTNSTARGRFGDSLAELDAAVDRLVAAAARTRNAAGTLTVWTSDNGPSLRNQVRGGCAGPLRCGKGTTFEGGMRVPCILHWPGRIRPGVRHDLATTLDLLPTFMELAGAGRPPGLVLDGASLAPMLLRGAPSGRSSVVYYPQFAQRSRGVYAVRVGRHKVHWKTQGSMQCVGERDAACGPDARYAVLPEPLVFDLDLDPGERWPLDTGSAEYRDAAAAAQAALAQHEAALEWNPAGPQLAWSVGGGWDARLQPCATPGCQPFPACCHA